MKRVDQVLREKGPDFWSVTPGATVFKALELMAKQNIGAVLVMEEGGLAGIFSERDYARKVVLEGKSSKDIPVKEIMTSKVVCVRPEQSIEECMALMTNKHIRHLPVIEGDQVVGVISLGDVVKAKISEQEFTISQLEHYITGVL
ncbi:MAG: CBS domain-containing protein [Holophagaceae bacterium]|nr:CBS domain-containing protein [Holophagaceae bacterium]